ncbi:MAG TPA: lysylphosphatidylglycerol synthase transmembrane domain-containing protein [Anaerolineae bacterium]|nr:lysylphosphatidylglycerol synthase transmembrane domain-containing protein [Anaerolineae bacterium]
MLRRWQFWLGVFVSVAFLWLALRGLKPEDVLAGLRSADYLWLLPGIAVYFVAVVVRTWRWHYLLRPLKEVAVRDLFPVVVIGYMGNNVYPARAGELLRAYVLKRNERVSASASLATVIVERIFDGVVMLLFVFVALPFAPFLPDALRSIVIGGSLIFLTALAVFLFLAARPALAARIYNPIIERLLPGRLREKARGLLDRFMTGLASLRDIQHVLMVFFTSILIWLLETVKYWFVMHAFSFEVSFFTLMLMNGIVNLATTLPAAPGYLGTFDAPGIAVLSAFGVAAPVATAYTLVLHAALWLPITLLGFFFMARQSLRWSDFAKAARLTDAEAAL